MDRSGCGFSFWKPRWLQRFASPKSFLIVYGLLGTTQAMAYIYFVVTLTTLEKRFKIPSKTTGYMLSGNEISQILLSLVLSYFGGQRNRPRWIAWGVFFCASSCFILALPHLLYGAGEDALALTKEYINAATTSNETQLAGAAQLCHASEDSCDKMNSGLGDESWTPLILVFMSQFVLGIGNTLYYSLGQTYLDDNTKKTNTPMLLAYAMALRMFGPVIGFVLGYFCLAVYIDPSVTPTIDKNDLRWLGAWWLGWIVLGFAMILFAVLIGLFPKQLPKKTHAIVAAATEEMPLQEKAVQVNREIEKESLKELPTLRDFPVALMRLLKNKLLIFNILSAVFYILGGSGYMTFLSKYLEVQFQRSAAGATIITGPATLIGMVAGFLISGYFISRKKPRPRLLLGWNVIVGMCYIIGQIAYLFMFCPDTGLQQYVENGNLDFTMDCNIGCDCTGPISPVCHKSTGQTFLSACHAGCTSIANLTSFTQCSCIPSMHSSEGNGTHDTGWNYLDPGPCTHGCITEYYLFILLSMAINLLGSSGKVGNLLVNFRSVEVKDKSFTQGLVLLMISLFALIPGPIVYGAIIDQTCVSWEWKCGQRGNCQMYDQYKFRIFINSVASVFTSIGVLFDILVWYLGKNLDLYGEDKCKKVDH